MASTRYGRVHIGRHKNYIKFASAKERTEFAEKFDNYHASHDHEGVLPRFEEITTKDAPSYEIGASQTWGDPHLTIDGYKAYEIFQYHNWSGYEGTYGQIPRYKPPKCCVSPLIVLERHGEFIDSGTLQRHDLSAIFGDMPDDDFEKLLESVNENGFVDPMIRIYEGKILDGWHRYKAALHLNIVRKLRFTQWDTEEEGDPNVFVLSRNIERRHLTPGQRAQIVVAFNERFVHGGDRKSDEIKSPNGELKTRQELAAEAGVGTRTIDRATAVDKAGESEAVISGEKTAGEVLKEQEDKRKRKKLTSMVNVLDAAVKSYDKNQVLDPFTFTELETAFERSHQNIADDFRRALDRINSIGLNGTLEELIESTLNAEVAIGDLEAECKAISIFSHQISNWKDQDWIRQLIEANRVSEEIDRLRGHIEKHVRGFREAYADVYKKGAVSVKDAFIAGITYYNLPKQGYEVTLDNPTGGYEDIERLKRIAGVTARMVLDFTESRVKAVWIRKSLANTESKKSEPDYEQLQQAHIARLEALPGEIRDYIPIWKKDNAITGDVTLKLLLNARSLLQHGFQRGSDPFFREEMEELLEFMQSNHERLVDKVNQLLTPDDTDDSDIELLPIQPVEETSSQTPDWEKIRSAMQVVSTELEKVEYSDEETSMIEQMTSDIKAIFDEYTSLSRDAKLWVLANLAHKCMENLGT